MNKRDRVILNKIVDEASIITLILQNVDETAFLNNEEKMRAVCMTLVNIGELVKNMTDELRSNNQHIPWKDLAGLRDVTAHGYFTLRMSDIWIYAAIELPEHVIRIKELLAQADDGNH